MNTKTAATAATTDPSGSWLQLFNPLSQLTGGNDRYPEWAANMFPGNRQAAWLTAKAGAAGLLAFALFGTMRGVQHFIRAEDMADKDDPARKLKSQIGTTFETQLAPPDRTGQEKKGSMQEKTAAPRQSVSMPDVTDIPANTINAVIPAAAFLAMAVAGWNTADAAANSRREAMIDTAIQNKGGAVRELIRTRARIAKGTASPSEVRRALDAATAEENFIKTGADRDESPWWRRGFAGLGLIMAALTAAGAIGGYTYGKASDEDNLKFKALKKGLEQYARTKASMTPVTAVPSDAAEYFASIDEGSRKDDVRRAPELQGGGQPVTVTL